MPSLHHTPRDVQPAPVRARRASWRGVIPLFVILAALLGGSLAPTGGSAQGDPTTQGQWSAGLNWPVIAIHANVLPNGNLLMWGRGTDHVHHAETYIWNPSGGQFVANLPVNRTNVFCAGHSFLPDGRLLVTGGHITPYVGSKDINIFDPATTTWSPGPTMAAARWYPTNVTLPNGEVLVIAGTITKKSNNTTPEVFTTTGGLRRLTGARSSLYPYPFMYLAPNGQVFLSGPDRSTRYLDTNGRGRWKTVGNRRYRSHREGSAVLYDTGKVLVAGGDDPPTATAEVIDLTVKRPVWRTVASMGAARRHLNLTLLPDGTVFVSGGTSGRGFNNEAGAVLGTELWDPATERFRATAPMAVPRIYHSVGLLLPDARVLAAGGEGEGGTPRSNAQIYSPPYLFRGARPQIGFAPPAVAYGQSFAVGTPDAASIRSVTWVRLPSVTHGYNMDQRMNRLQFTAGSGALNVIAPSDPKLCPPGPYMLFILNSNGVPSVARIISIR